MKKINQDPSEGERNAGRYLLRKYGTRAAGAEGKRFRQEDGNPIDSQKMLKEVEG